MILLQHFLIFEVPYFCKYGQFDISLHQVLISYNYTVLEHLHFVWNIVFRRIPCLGLKFWFYIVYSTDVPELPLAPIWLFN